MVTEKKCDVVVVGLGAMGSAIIDQLAMKGVDVIGFDQFVPPHAEGSSHGETRLTRESVGEGAEYVPLVQASHKRWKELEKEFGVELFAQKGLVMVGDEKSGKPGRENFFKSTAELADRFGIAHSILDRESLVKKFPQFSGMKENEIAYYEPGAGYVFPERCIEQQLKHARQHKATICTGVTVRGIESVGNGVRVRTDDTVVEARQVVVSAGAWVTDLIGQDYKKLFTVRRQLLHWLQLEDGVEIPADAPALGWLHSGNHFIYGFPPQPGSRAFKLATEQKIASMSHASLLDRQVTPEESQEFFDTHIKNRVVGVSNKVADAVACMYTMTPDEGFVLDYLPEQPNVFVVSACSGHGFKHSAGIGQAVAEKILGEPSRFDLRPFSFARFSGARSIGKPGTFPLRSSL